jgi:phage replication-related protein YjqB (UPF0714/DUF867 family)
MGELRNRRTLAAVDEYPNYAALSANEREGIDYRICSTLRDSPVAISRLTAGASKGALPTSPRR